MENCIFCKISKGEIPSNKVYEDNKFLSFLDIQPVSKGHILLIPKVHVEWMQEADDETISEIFKISKKLMLAMKNGIGCDYVQVSVVGKDVPHFHVHLIPRYLNDGLPQFPTENYSEEDTEEVKRKIISSIR